MFEPPPWEDAVWARARAVLLQCLDAGRPSAAAGAALAAWPPQDAAVLVGCAEFHGMTALAARHAAGRAPAALRRALAPLLARARHAARVRKSVLTDLFEQCDRRGIDVLLLKGAALCETAYPDPVLRPMRDIDLMAAPRGGDALLDAMASVGFVALPTRTPAGHHHLTPRCLVRDHVSVCVEPHVALGLAQNINITPEALFAAAAPSVIYGARARVPSLAHMLWHVYRHGFTMPFDTEATKLIWVADLHALVESHAGTPALAAALAARPRLRRVLAALHGVCPWSPQAQSALAPVPLGAAALFDDYAGWPRAALARPNGFWAPQALRATVWPPKLWLAMRKGARPGRIGRAGMVASHWRDLLQARMAHGSRTNH